MPVVAITHHAKQRAGNGLGHEASLPWHVGGIKKADAAGCQGSIRPRRLARQRDPRHGWGTLRLVFRLYTSLVNFAIFECRLVIVRLGRGKATSFSASVSCH